MKKTLLIFLVSGMISGMSLWMGCKKASVGTGERELAVVTDLDILLLESFPLQAMVHVKGYLPSPCYDLMDKDFKVERQENVFTVELFQLFHRDMTCIQVTVPYSINIPLDIYNLKAGIYEVIVNSKKTSFELLQDNSIPGTH